MQRVLPKLLSATVLLLPAIALTSQAAFADQRDFQLVNDSRIQINEVYVSTVSTDDWEEDVLGRDVLGVGETTRITFSRGVSGTCAYDIRVVTAQNRAVERANVNLCETNDVIFNGSQLLTR